MSTPVCYLRLVFNYRSKTRSPAGFYLVRRYACYHKFMKCPKCGYGQQGGPLCLRCGIVFSKYSRRSEGGASEYAAPLEPGLEEEAEQGIVSRVFLYVKPEIDIFNFGGRILLYIVIVVSGAACIVSPMDYESAPLKLLHLVNLPFHEAGHIIFGVIGSRLLAALGGSLMQLLVPLVCVLAFLLQTRDTFGAAVGVWWLGESFMDLAPYINDSRSLNMVLLGGVTGREVADYHDWEFILRNTGLLRLDHAIAYSAYGLGTALMLIAFVWGGYLLLRQYRSLDW